MSRTLKPCPVREVCGGCQLQNMTYERQLKWKQARCEILLKKYGKVRKIIGMENPLHYRNKVQAAFGRTRSGKIISGGKLFAKIIFAQSLSLEV